MSKRHVLIDATQYSNWSEKIFHQMNKAGLSAVCVTICYHENFRETVANITAWNRRFADLSGVLMLCRSGQEILQAAKEGRTGIIYALQNCSAIEDDIGLVEILHQLGVRVMQLTYNNQSLLAAGCYEDSDSGITRFGKQVISEMNRLGMIIDMSHSAEKSTLQAMDYSRRPVAITHANPADWHPSIRGKSHAVLRRLKETKGMLGLSLYPHHLKGGSNCTLQEFCKMVADVADTVGIDHIGIGSDLCQNQPDEVVNWMRNGRWSRNRDFGEGTASNPGFPPQPTWFQNNEDFPRLRDGLTEIGFSENDTQRILGENWLRFFSEGFEPEDFPHEIEEKSRISLKNKSGS